MFVKVNIYQQRVVQKVYDAQIPDKHGCIVQSLVTEFNICISEVKTSDLFFILILLCSLCLRILAKYLVPATYFLICYTRIAYSCVSKLKFAKIN